MRTLTAISMRGRDMAETIRVLIATGIFPPDIGGPATYAKLLAERLPATGCIPTVLPFGPYRRWPKGLRHLLYAQAVYRAARRVDVVFAQDTLSVGLAIWLGCRLARRPYVLRVPGDHVWEWAVQRAGIAEGIDAFQTKGYGRGIEWRRQLRNLVVRGAAAVITPSDYFNRLVRAWVPGKSVTTIYNGIEPIDSVSAGEKIPRTIVSAGRLVPWKGFDFLIQCLPAMPAWQLEIIGDGPDRARLLELAATIGVSERVHFSGQLPRPAVLERIARSAVFALLSGFESFSFQVVEAMRVGTPIIATKIGSLPELITSGAEGVLIPPGDQEAFLDAIKELDDPARSAVIAAAARQKSLTFSIDRTITETAALLRTVPRV